MSTASFPLPRFKAFVSWVNNLMLNLQVNKLTENLRTHAAHQSGCDTCNYHHPTPSLRILTYQRYLLAVSSADACQLGDV